MAPKDELLREYLKQQQTWKEDKVEIVSWQTKILHVMYHRQITTVADIRKTYQWLFAGVLGIIVLLHDPILSKLYLLTDGLSFNLKKEFIVDSMTAIFLGPFAAKQAQIITPPPLCLTRIPVDRCTGPKTERKLKQRVEHTYIEEQCNEEKNPRNPGMEEKPEMGQSREQVFVSKVLTRLYPEDISCSSNLQVSSLISKNKTTDNTTQEDETIVQAPAECSQGAEACPPGSQKVYTVSLPPEDYLPSCQNDLKHSNSESSGNDDDTEAVPRAHRRRRKKKRVEIVPQSVPKNDNRMPQTIPHLQIPDHVPINKNKKRKLQRKRQKERLKAAGLWKKDGSGDLMYPTEELEEEKKDLNHPNDASDEEELQKKSHDLLDFLEATHEIYFTDSKSRCANDTLSAETILEILSQLKTGEIPSSDITILHHLKTLVLLQDIERLKDSLGSFKEHSSLSIDHKMALSSLFDYWITDILPMQNKD
ncbi:glutamate-rich protein 1 [Pelodytes ibericus]